MSNADTEVRNRRRCSRLPTVPGVNGVELTRTLTELHRSCTPEARVHLVLPSRADVGDQELADIAEGGGFVIRRRFATRASVLHRQWTIPDTVAPAMRLLICGLNPSPSAAEAGVGFARPGNRFWPVALAAGLVTRDRDPDDALAKHGIGMTDIVKRTTRRADELGREEFRLGLGRVTRLAARLQPRGICFVGLQGWRTVIDAKAGPGWQHRPLGDRPVYVMPSTSGLNASSRLDDLTAHLHAAWMGPPG